MSVLNHISIMSEIFLLLFCFTLIISTLIFSLKKRLQYWQRKNVVHKKPNFLLGNFGDFILLKKFSSGIAQKLCESYPDEPYIGAYYGTEPTLIVQDPELIKLVLTKDFYYFSGREICKYTHKEVFTQNLFFTFGDRWKVIRQNLTPLFSSSKMKSMFHLIEKCSMAFEKMLDYETGVSQTLEARSLMARFTMDCVGSCAFGINTGTLNNEVSNNPFRTMGNLIFQVSNYRGFKNVARAIWPSIFYGMGFKSFPPEINTFFQSLITKVFEGRQYQPTSRNDFIDLILNFKKNEYISGDSLKNFKVSDGKKIDLEVNDELLVAQCIMFFAAGFETSSTTLCFTLYELAKNEEAQARVFDEIDEYLRRHDNKLNYECVNELPYLEACTDEALRLYPVLGLLTREVMEDYTFPTGLRVEKGMRVHIPVYHLQRDPRNFPDPEEFKPERFLGANKKDIKYGTYMPFGEGPRICIGMRFAKMLMLSGLVTLLKKYKVELAEGTPRKVDLEPKSIVTQPVNGIKLNLVQRTKWEERMFTAKVS